MDVSISSRKDTVCKGRNETGFKVSFHLKAFFCMWRAPFLFKFAAGKKLCPAVEESEREGLSVKAPCGVAAPRPKNKNSRLCGGI